MKREPGPPSLDLGSVHLMFDLPETGWAMQTWTAKREAILTHSRIYVHKTPRNGDKQSGPNRASDGNPLDLAVGQAAMQAAHYLFLAPDVVCDSLAGAYGRFLALEDIFDGHGWVGCSGGVGVEQTGRRRPGVTLSERARRRSVQVNAATSRRGSVTPEPGSASAQFIVVDRPTIAAHSLFCASCPKAARSHLQGLQLIVGVILGAGDVVGLELVPETSRGERRCNGRSLLERALSCWKWRRQPLSEA